jgi:thiol-disulfide isomerase/thioredoxin
MSLQDRLDAFKADLENGKLPFKPTAQQLDAMHRATAELIATGQAQRALKAGDKAPDFVLNDPDGKPVSLRELLAKGPLVVSFYRGVWCPYCNMELQALQGELPAIEARGASLVAISPQTPPQQPKVGARQQAHIQDPQRCESRSGERLWHPLCACRIISLKSTKASRPICRS